MMRLFISLTLCLMLSAFQLSAQEICNNNLDDDGDGQVDCVDGECGAKACEVCNNAIDDDGDGFIDCYDKECSSDIACEGSMFNDLNCEATPSSFPPIEIKLKYRSAVGTAYHVGRVVAGDIDRDGTLELATPFTKFDGTAVQNSQLNLFHAPPPGSTTLSLSKTVSVPHTTTDGVIYHDIAMADINKDSCAEFFVLSGNIKNATSYKIYAFDCNGNSLWANPIAFTSNPGMIGLADFDHDGMIELYSRTRIFDAHTGVLLGSNNVDNDNTGINSGVNKGWGMNDNAPVAIDILGNTSNLELVAGCRIYDVKINRATMSAVVTMVRQRGEYATRTGVNNASNGTTVADFNQDGFLDVLAVGSINGYDANTTIFFWDVEHDQLKTYSDQFVYKEPNSSTPDPNDSVENTNYKFGWRNGAGRITVADIDGDTLMNAVYISGRYLYALKAGNSGLELLWKAPVGDETSGYTGCTAFDFDGDGKSEIVYRDEDFLRIYSTDANGVVTQSQPQRCVSRTQNEYPIITDVDGDGAAEICVTCSSNDAVSGRMQNLWSDGEIRVYESANYHWRPSRRVWNQHGYFVTNVNDDLTIPAVQQQPHLIYAKNAECRNGGTSRPLNAFMSQISSLNTSGCPSFAAPNLTVVPFKNEKLIDYSSFTCLDETFQVIFHTVNKGTFSFDGYLNVSFYSGDPRLESPLATLIDTKTVLVLGMNPNDTITMSADLPIPLGAFDLYVVINDDGTTIPLDISAQSGRVIECDYDNVATILVEPSPITIVAELVQGNIVCSTAPGLPSPANVGALKAYVLHDDIQDATNFNFNWSNGPTVGSLDYVGSNYTALAGGVYTVYAVNKTLNCSSDPVSVVVVQTDYQVDVHTIVESNSDDLTNPNGKLRAIVNDLDHDGTGAPEDGFEFAWYQGESILVGDIIGTDPTLTGLSAGTYSVVVRDKTTGCYDSAHATIDNIMGTEEAASLQGVTMYPNPGTDAFTIQIDNAFVGDVHFQLESVLGKDVSKKINKYKSTRTLTIPVETRDLKSGVYLIKISLGKNTAHKKWIKR